MNINVNSANEVPEYFADKDAIFCATFDLDINVVIESRRVTSITVLISTIVGVKIFFHNCLDLFLPILQEKTKIRELMNHLYHVEDDGDSSPHSNKVKIENAYDDTNLSNYPKMFERFKFSFFEGVKFINIHASPRPF